jgi:hypothetical protein
MTTERRIVITIEGGQGTGKSMLAAFLKTVIDGFRFPYKENAERVMILDHERCRTREKVKAAMSKNSDARIAIIVKQLR